MNNYLVKYTGYNLPSGRQMAVEGVNITVTPENSVIDCFEELKAKRNLDPYGDKFKEKLNKLFAVLILDYKFEPHFSLEKAKFIMIDTRNDDILLGLQADQLADITKLRKELSNKQTSLRVSMEEDVEVLRQKLVSEMLKNKGEVSKDEMFIFKQEELIKRSPEMAQTEQIVLRADIAKAQTRVESYRSQIARDEVGIREKVTDLRTARLEDIKAVEDKFLSLIADLDAENAKTLSVKVSELIDKREGELDLIQRVLDMNIEITDSSLEDLLEEKTVPQLKELAVKFEIEITETLKDKIIEQIIASEKYAV